VMITVTDLEIYAHYNTMCYQCPEKRECHNEVLSTESIINCIRMGLI